MFERIRKIEWNRWLDNVAVKAFAIASGVLLAALLLSLVLGLTGIIFSSTCGIILACILGAFVLFALGIAFYALFFVKNKPAELEYEEEDAPLDKNVKLMSPMQMVLRRFFRSKLSIIGLIMLISLFAFCWIGPYLYTSWEASQVDRSIRLEYAASPVENDGNIFYQVTETEMLNVLAQPSEDHVLGTTDDGKDVLAVLMAGGRVSLSISFIAVFLVTFLGVIFGSIAGYAGGVIDNIIMRLCDILMCLPGFPILLILGKVLEGWSDTTHSPLFHQNVRIYWLMAFLALISWSGTARLVRGQILYLREQEYMVAAEAMGYSVWRKIFKHLVPNIMPQLIVSMTLSLGSMILYEASLSYLGIGAPPDNPAWGTMINAVQTKDIFINHFHVWGPPGICIILAVLGFNFVGDGLRDALDPKMRR